MEEKFSRRWTIQPFPTKPVGHYTVSPRVEGPLVSEMAQPAPYRELLTACGLAFAVPLGPCSCPTCRPWVSERVAEKRLELLPHKLGWWLGKRWKGEALFAAAVVADAVVAVGGAAVADVVGKAFCKA